MRFKSSPPYYFSVMLKKTQMIRIAQGSVIAAVLVTLHQMLNWGIWFDIWDIHHETFVLVFLAIALVSYGSANTGWVKWINSKR